MELENPSSGYAAGDNGVSHDPLNPFDDYFDSACSTPFVSAPSSPGRGCGGVVAGAFFFSAPSSPMHYVLTSSSAFSSPVSNVEPSSFEFEFSARFPASAAASAAGSMCSADELFLNGRIRPMKLSSHLQRPQNLSPLIDLDPEEHDEGGGIRAGEIAGEIGGCRGRDLKLRSRSIHRRARSHSPLRNVPFLWRLDDGEPKEVTGKNDSEDPELKQQLETETPPVSASSSRSSSTSSSSSSSSSSSFNRKRWIFLKDLLHRSRSEGSGKTKEKFWHHLSFAVPKERSKLQTPYSSPSIPPSPTSDPAKEKRPAASTPSNSSGTPAAQRPGANSGRRRRPVPSAHERHYTANRAQAEEMRRKTFLPYRQGLFGCLGLSSRGYGAINGFARSLHSFSSR